MKERWYMWECRGCGRSGPIQDLVCDEQHPRDLPCPLCGAEGPHATLRMRHGEVTDFLRDFGRTTGRLDTVTTYFD